VPKKVCKTIKLIENTTEVLNLVPTKAFETITIRGNATHEELHVVLLDVSGAERTRVIIPPFRCLLYLSALWLTRGWRRLQKQQVVVARPACCISGALFTKVLFSKSY
jgi:hypothetical protein